MYVYEAHISYSNNIEVNQSGYPAGRGLVGVQFGLADHW